MIDPITYFSLLLGISPVRVALYLPLIILFSNFLSRLIPDTATGWKGVARQILAVIGLYASSRIAPGLTVSDISKMVIQPPMDGAMAGKITEHAVDQMMQNPIPDFMDASVTGVGQQIKNNPFRRRPDGRAAPTEDGFVTHGMLRSIMLIAFVGVILAGCTTLGGPAAKTTLNYVCQNRETIRATIDALAEKLNICPILDERR